MEKEINKIESFIRKSISEEQLAVADYLKRKNKVIDLLEETDDEDVTLKLQTFITTLDDIIAEEEIHIGQFTSLLNIFNVSQENEQKGMQEAQNDYAETIGDIDDILSNWDLEEE